MNARHNDWLRIVLLVGSVVVVLLASRLLNGLFAADPAHPFVQMVRVLTTPLVLPLAWIDANQPLHGARFERGTLVLALIVLIALGAGARALCRRTS